MSKLDETSKLKLPDWLSLSLRDWSLLPDDIIYLIVSRMKSIEDLMAMSSVCHSWRLVTVKDYSTRRVQLPWMMISPSYTLEPKGFFSIDKHKHYNITLPNSQHSRYWGSKFGWLVVISYNRQMYLLNPVTRALLDLPPKPIFGDEIDHDDRDNHANSVPGFVRKALVFKDEAKSNVNNDKYIVVVIGSIPGNLAFSRPGENNWVHIKTPSNLGRVVSAVWCNEKLFFMLGSAALMSYEKNDSGKYEMNKIVPETNDVFWGNDICLVDWLGELLCVMRFICRRSHWYQTCRFVVFKLDIENKDWVETKDLGDCALFYGADDNTMALKASEVKNCKANSIYFLEKHWDRYGRYLERNDVGVFNLKNKTIQPYFVRNPFMASSLKQNPIWLMPSLGSS